MALYMYQNLDLLIMISQYQELHTNLPPLSPSLIWDILMCIWTAKGLAQACIDLVA